MIEKPSGKKKIEKADKKQKKSTEKKNIKIQEKSEEETILKNAFFESSVTANYTTDINCIVNYINPEFLNIWGYSNKEEVIGKPLSVFFRNDVTMNLIIRTLNESGKWKGGYIGIKKDGSSFISECSASSIYNEKGEQIGYQFTNIDITTHKKIDDDTHKSEEQFRKIFEDSPLGMVFVDEMMKFTKVNPAFCEMTGYTETELLKLSLKDITHPDFLKDNIKGVQQLFRGDIPIFKTEKIYVKKNKELFWGSVTVTEVLNKVGDFLHFLAMVENISERKLTEIALQSSEKKYRKLHESVRDGFVVVDMPGHIIECNEQYMEMLGYTRIELEKLTYFDITPVKWYEYEQKIVEEQIIPRGYSDIYEKEYIRKNGTIFPIELNVFLIKNENGENEAMGSIVRDISERRKQEEYIMNISLEWQNTFDAVQDVIWHLDKNQVITRSNKATEIMLGRKNESVIGHHCFEIVHGTTEPIPTCPFSKMMISQKRESHEFSKNGKWYIETTDPMFDGNGEISGSVHILSDITNKKLADEQIIKERNIAQNYLDIAEVIFLVLDENMKVTLINKKGCEILGYSENEIKGKNWFDNFVPGGDRNRIKDSFGKMMSGEIEKFENNINNILTRSGEEKIISWHNTILKDDTGKIIGTLSSGFDVTKQRQSEIELAKIQMELQKSEERYRTLIENQGEGIVLIDMNEVFVFANSAANEIFGVEGDTLAGKSLKDFISDEIFEFMKQDAEMKSGLKKRSYEIEITKPNGVKGNLLMTLTPRFNDIEELIGTFGIFRDITERKIYEKEILNAKKKAEESEQAKATFLANMSHELRTPMVGILGYSELLCETTKDENTKEMAEAIMMSGMRLKDTLNLILDLSKLERGKVAVHYKNIDLIRSTKNVIDLYKASAQNKKLDLELITSFKVLNVILDDRLLFEILSNLINNAIKYTNAGSITVEVSRDKDEWIVIKVKDTGIGIPKEKQNIIFDEFRQASEGFSRTFEGTGLGLTITNNFIELMNGEIKVESELGKGSTFTVRLPKKELDSDKESKPGREVKTPAGENQREYSVLCVDNDTTNNLLVKLILNESYILDIAINDVTALEMVKKKKYDVILLDINLGEGINGLEVLKKIREIPEYKKTPVVALTAFAMVGDKEEFLSKGCDLYLSKPYTRNMLKSIVKEAVEKIYY